ncbi:MAG: TatD family hydrolase [Clostridia bacterium]|nr:TatD family hydrolase [Clostridia bacterium]
MKIFDTHAHLSDKRFDEDRDELISGLKDNGVELVCEVGCDLRDVSATLALTQKYPFVYGAVGMHPHTAQFMDNGMADGLREMLKGGRIVALGEIGLDYYYDLSPRDKQREVFDMQLSIAAEAGAPVILHIRDAIGDSLDVLRAHKAELVKNGGITHCYSGSAESAKDFLDLGLVLGFGGSLTFKNNRKGVETAAIVPLDRFVFETDCPYLAPVPHRGERNDPTLARFAIERFAQIRGLDPEAAAELGFENGRAVYRLCDK